MKKILNLLVILLAIHFLAVVAGALWLVQTGHVDSDRFAQVKQIVFPPPPPPTTAPLATPDDPTTRPTARLDELLAKQTGRTAAEQVDFIQHTFDAQLARIDRRERELVALQRQIDLAKAQVTRDRATLDTEQRQLAAREAQAVKLQSDQGFQDSLDLYKAMPAKQVKTIFMGLDDSTIISYLQAMEPRTASKILKEFKTADEISRIELIMEKMRLAQASTKE